MPATRPSLFTPYDNGWIFPVRVTPKASRNSIAGLDRAQDGSTYLKVKVTAVPEDGKANAAVIKLLAKDWKVPKGSISVVRGDTSRNKTLKITCGLETHDHIITQLEKMDS
jgi:uncharacterized protein (TIGR00251 family)